jgi:hypothetical protein
MRTSQILKRKQRGKQFSFEKNKGLQSLCYFIREGTIYKHKDHLYIKLYVN